MDLHKDNVANTVIYHIPRQKEYETAINYKIAFNNDTELSICLDEFMIFTAKH